MGVLNHVTPLHYDTGILFFLKKLKSLQVAAGFLGLPSLKEFFRGKGTRALALNGGWNSGLAVVTEAAVGKGSVFMVFAAAVTVRLRRFSFSWPSRSFLTERNSMWGRGLPREVHLFFS